MRRLLFLLALILVLIPAPALALGDGVTMPGTMGPVEGLLDSGNDGADCRVNRGDGSDRGWDEGDTGAI